MYGHVSSLEGTVCIPVLKQPNLGGAFKYVLCSPLFWGRWSNLTCTYFSDGLLQPPTNSSKLSGGFWDLGPRCWNRWFTPKNQAFKKKDSSSVPLGSCQQQWFVAENTGIRCYQPTSCVKITCTLLGWKFPWYIETSTASLGGSLLESDL